MININVYILIRLFSKISLNEDYRYILKIRQRERKRFSLRWRKAHNFTETGTLALLPVKRQVLGTRHMHHEQAYTRPYLGSMQVTLAYKTPETEAQLD